MHIPGGCTVDGYLRNGRDNLSASGLDGMNLLLRPARKIRLHFRRRSSSSESASARPTYPVYCNPAFQIEEFGSDAEGLFKQILGFAEAGADGVKLGDGEAGGEC